MTNLASCLTPQRTAGRDMSRRSPRASRLTLLALAAALALSAGPALPDTIAFSGFAGASWTIGNNWWGGSLPSSGDTADLGNFDTRVQTAGTVLVRNFYGSGRLSLLAGALSFSDASEIGSLELAGASLLGAGSLTVIRASTWSAGALGGTGGTHFNSGLTISGGAKTVSQRSLVLAGNSAWSDNGSIAFSNGAVLTNNGSFMDHTTSSASLSSGAGANNFVNNGSYIKAGVGTTTIDTAFNNYGTLAVKAGTLNLSAGVNGGGSLNVEGGTLSIALASLVGSLSMSSGTSSGAGALTVIDASNWTGGTMSGSGTTQIYGGLAISGIGAKNLDTRRLILAGSSNWNGAGTMTFSNGAVLTNDGSFLDQNTGPAKLAVIGANNQFINVGSYTKSGAGTTTIEAAFINSGTLAVNAGTLNLSGGINRGTSGGAGVNVAGGTLSVAKASSLGSLNLSSGSLAGTGALTVSNASTWTGGAMSGSGSSNFSRGLAISGGGSKTLNQRQLILAGSSSWSGNGSIAFSDAAVLTNNGSFTDQNAGFANVTSSGAGNRFVNAGTYTKSGFGTTVIDSLFINNGVLALNASVLVLNGSLSGSGTVSLVAGSALGFTGTSSLGSLDMSGGTLSGNGALTVDMDSTWTGGTMRGSGARASNTFNQRLTIRNLATKELDERDLILAGPSSWSGGQIRLSDGAVLTNTATFDDQNTGIVNLSSSGTGGNRFQNNGIYLKSGNGTTTIASAFSNPGTLTVMKGTLNMVAGFGGSFGSVNLEAGAALSLGANSSTGKFTHAGTLYLDANNLAVAQDYSNANFGVGNAFDRHAGVIGSGQILALGSVQQTLSGERIQLGNTANAVLTLPNMRVGAAPVSTSFKINNVSTGASLRGAIQNGGITTAALSGSGVTAQNWGALVAGSSSGAYTISYAPTVAGNGLAGQSLAIVNNFDNVAGQTLSITGGKAYAPAVAQLGSNTLDFGIVHVGDTVGRGITVRNGAAVAALNDVLRGNASGGGGAFLVNGSLAGLAAGAQDSGSLKVGLNTTQAGLFNGAATLAFASHNADMSDLALAGQQVALTAQVNNYAALGLNKLGGAGSFSAGGNAYWLDFGTLKQGGASLGAELGVGNAAQGLADLLGLSFELGTASSHFSLSGFGPVTGLAAGESQGGLQISFSGLLAGRFDEVIMLHATGSNASGYGGALPDVQLHLRGEVVAVPEPASWALFTLGLIGMQGFLGRRCLAGRRAGVHLPL